METLVETHKKKTVLFWTCSKNGKQENMPDRARYGHVEGI